MSDGTNFYNKLLGYILWIDREGSPEPEQVYIPRESKVKLSCGKEYKITLRNLKLYLVDLKKIDPTILSIQIDRLSRVGKLKFPKETK
jgi:hypothetical protein